MRSNQGFGWLNFLTSYRVLEKLEIHAILYLIRSCMQYVFVFNFITLIDSVVSRSLFICGISIIMILLWGMFLTS